VVGRHEEWLTVVFGVLEEGAAAVTKVSSPVCFMLSFARNHISFSG